MLKGCLRASVQEGKVWVIDPLMVPIILLAQLEDFAVMMAYFENGQDSLVTVMMWSRDCYHGGGNFSLSK